VNTAVWLIVGLGKTGVSCARYLHRQGQAFAIYDTRQEPPGLDDVLALDANCTVYTQALDVAILTQYAGLIISPGISIHTPEIQQAMHQGVEVIGDIELFARAATKPIIGITGSNGKSTVTTLVGNMLRMAGYRVGVGGNIGLPALDLLVDEVDCYVLELSSFQLETTHSLVCHAAVVLNVSEDHMDRHADLAEYATLKQSVYQQAGFALVNRADAWVVDMVPAEDAVSFGLDAPMVSHWGISEHGWLAKGAYEFLDPELLKIKGQHNWSNVLVAVALAESMGASIPSCLGAAYDFAGLPHRMQWVAEFGGNEWINDSKATNVGACLAAIQGMPRPVVLLAGGEGKGADFSALKPAIAAHVSTLILFGRDAEKIHQAVGDAVPVVLVADMLGAVQAAQKAANTGDIILLSPACASFDLYQNYEHRGTDFCTAVAALQRGSR